MPPAVGTAAVTDDAIASKKQLLAKKHERAAEADKLLAEFTDLISHAKGPDDYQAADKLLKQILQIDAKHREAIAYHETVMTFLDALENPDLMKALSSEREELEEEPNDDSDGEGDDSDHDRGDHDDDDDVDDKGSDIDEECGDDKVEVTFS